MSERTYIAIDLKSFYASVECVERGLDPLTTNLVVADESRTSKTICLAVSPSLKAYGIPGRARLFEVEQRVKEVNRQRGCRFERRDTGRQNRSGQGITTASEPNRPRSSWSAPELEADPTLAVDFIVAKPQMARYMACSSQIYQIYLKYIAPEDIHVYSVDEVFIDATAYLGTYQMTGHELAMTMIRDVLSQTGITATAGIGTNLYLCKIAMDIEAKHMPADGQGVRIAELDEMSYRRRLWDHQPITDFWRVGRGYARKLAEHGLYTMGDIARCSLGRDSDYYNEELLYRLFGINAELLIDHAWGWEPCTIEAIKAYKPQSNSISSGQVLMRPYHHDEARLIVSEMADALSLDLVDKRLVTDQLVLDIGYDTENVAAGPSADRDAEAASDRGSEWNPGLEAKPGPGRGSEADPSRGTKTDRYGRKVPKPAHGSLNLEEPTSSTRVIIDGFQSLFDRIAHPTQTVRRLTLTACHVQPESKVSAAPVYEQMDLFTDYADQQRRRQEEEEKNQRERRMQEALLSIKKKYGGNAVLKGMNLREGATGRDRNRQIGGHKA